MIARRYIGCAALLVLAAVRPEAGAAGEAADRFDARITKVEGNATVYYHDQGDQGVSAEAGMPLDGGDRVTTDDESSAEIGIEGDSAIELGPRSQFTVSDLDKKNTVFSLELGSLLGKVRALFASGGQMQIRTPTAVASVRGTEFGVDHAAEAGTRVGVFDEGKVAVAGGGGGPEVLLQSNQETAVARGRGPEAPRPLELFKARRERMRRVIQRSLALRRSWRRLDPRERTALRRKIFKRRLELMRRIREKRRNLKREGAGERAAERRERKRLRKDR